MKCSYGITRKPSKDKNISFARENAITSRRLIFAINPILVLECPAPGWKQRPRNSHPLQITSTSGQTTQQQNIQPTYLPDLRLKNVKNKDGRFIRNPETGVLFHSEAISFCSKT